MDYVNTEGVVIQDLTGVLSVNKGAYYTTKSTDYDTVVRGTDLEFDTFVFDKELNRSELDKFASDYLIEELSRKKLSIDKVFFMPCDFIGYLNTLGKPLYCFMRNHEGKYEYELETHYNRLSCLGHDAVLVGGEDVSE